MNQDTLSEIVLIKRGVQVAVVGDTAEQHCRSKGQQYSASKTPRSSRDVYQVSGSEGAVALRVMIEGQEVAAILDTGATPCVIDKGTASSLKLDKRIIYEHGRVYGLCNNPIQVIGYKNGQD